MEFRAAMEGLAPSIVNVIGRGSASWSQKPAANGLLRAEEAGTLVGVPNVRQSCPGLGLAVNPRAGPGAPLYHR